jgi:hypothetical protein
MISWSVRTFGDKVVARKLRAMANRAANFMPVWPEIVELAALAYDRSYREQGPGWADLATPTKRSKAAQHFSVYPIRERTGKDRRTMTNPANLHFSGTARTVDIEGPSDTPAAFHQEGGGKLPARPLKVSLHHQNMMAKALHNSLSEAYDHG